MDDDAEAESEDRDMLPEESTGMDRLPRVPSSPLARGGRFAMPAGGSNSPAAKGGLSASNSGSGSGLVSGSSGVGLTPRSTPLNPARLTRGPSELNLRANEQRSTPIHEPLRSPSTHVTPAAQQQQPLNVSTLPSIQPFDGDAMPMPSSPRKSPKSPQRSEPMFIREQPKGIWSYMPVAVALFLGTLAICMVSYVWYRVDHVGTATTVAGSTAGQSVGMQAAQVDSALLVAGKLQTNRAEFGTSSSDFTFARPQAPSGTPSSSSTVQGQDAASGAGGNLVLRSGAGGGPNAALAGDIILQVPGTNLTSGARRLLVASQHARDVVTITGSTAQMRVAASDVEVVSDAAINMQGTSVVVDGPLHTPVHTISLPSSQSSLTIDFGTLPRGAVSLAGTLSGPRLNLELLGCAGTSVISTLYLINALNVDVLVPSTSCRRPTGVPLFDVYVRAGDTAAFTCWAGTLQCPLEGAVVSLNQRVQALSPTGDLSALLLRLDALEAAMALKASTASLNELSANVTTALNAGLATKADVAAVNAKADLTALNGLASAASLAAGLALKANVSDVSSTYATLDALALKADTTTLSALAAVVANKTDSAELATYALASDLASKADVSALSAYVLLDTLVTNYTLAADVSSALALKADKVDVASQLAPLAVRADIDAALALKANATQIPPLATTAAVDAALALKADIALLNSYAFSADLSAYSTTAQTNATIASVVATAIQTKADSTAVDSSVARIESEIATLHRIKANVTSLDATSALVSANTAAIALRATITSMTSALALKADSTSLALKADQTALNALDNSLATINALKANATAVAAIGVQVAANTADIAARATSAAVTSALALKADASALSATTSSLLDSLSLKANRTELSNLTTASTLSNYATTVALTNGLAAKVDSTTLSSYVTKGTFDTTVTTLNAAINDKAAQTDLTALTTTVSDLSADTVHAAVFTQFQTDNTANLADKVSTATLTDYKAVVTAALALKADTSSLSSYATSSDLTSGLALKSDSTLVSKMAQADWFYPVQYIESQVIVLRQNMNSAGYNAIYTPLLQSKTIRSNFELWATADTWVPPP